MVCLVGAKRSALRTEAECWCALHKMTEPCLFLGQPLPDIASDTEVTTGSHTLSRPGSTVALAGILEVKHLVLLKGEERRMRM
jgi:hypothetical protein